jgi:sugar lactone lactonase YvrE
MILNRALQLQHVATLGGRGSAPAMFHTRVTGIAVDANDRLFAVGDQEVKCFDPRGELANQFTTTRPGWSVCVAEDARTLWIGMQGRVEGWDIASGQPRETIDDPQRLGRVTGVAVRGTTLLAADATNRAIRLYTEGVWQSDVGTEANTRGFMLPNGVLDLALDRASDTFVVAHPQKHRVERYGIQGEWVTKFGRFGMEKPDDFGGCCNPTNITAGPEGLIAVSEKAPPRIKLFTPQGEFLAASTASPFDANAKNIDLAIDRRGRLYATDPERCTIEVFQIAEAS